MKELDINMDNAKEALSVIKNPFFEEKITSFSLNMSSSLFDGRKYYWGNVKFKNGKTEGIQKIENLETFEELISELKQVIESLRRQ